MVDEVLDEIRRHRDNVVARFNQDLDAIFRHYKRIERRGYARGIERAMTKNEFHDRLRQMLNRAPFVPFAVELRNGSRIVVERPPVVFSDGAASFIDPNDGALVEFFHNQVEDFAVLEKERAT